MPTDFTSYGNQDLRLYMKNNWNFIALVDNGGNEVIRREVPADPGTQFSADETNNPLQAEVIITGQDVQDEGGSLPITFTRSESYETASSTNRTSYDPFSDATLDAKFDELVLTHEYKIPK